MTSRAAPCVGVVLAGGRARRFDGRPKGLELVAGRRIADRAADAVRQVSDALLVAGSPAGADDWLPGIPRVPDDVPDAGPLAGLLAALRHADAAVLLVGWDMPFVSPALLGELRWLAERSGAAACVPESDAAGRLEPLCAYYASTCAPTAADLLAAGRRSMLGLLDAVAVERIPLRRVLDFGDPGRIFLNVNTPADLELAERLAIPSLALP
jgi:molybdopterin-guanine dinucleotide biosynthesis protein A